MRLMQRLAGLLVLFALSAAVLISVDPAFGQTSSSPVEQLMQGLGPDQLQSITQQLGVGGTGAQQNTTPVRPPPFNEEQQDMMLRQQRDMLIEAQRQRTEAQRLSPFLQAEDWVVVTIDYNPLPSGNQPPPTAQPQLSALTGVTPQQQNILGNLAPSLGTQGTVAQSGVTGAAGNPNNPNNLANGVAAATAAATTPPSAQGVTAGGYAPLPPPCTGQPNCDTSQPAQPELTDEEKKQRQALIDLIRSKNPYQLTREGGLQL